MWNKFRENIFAFDYRNVDFTNFVSTVQFCGMLRFLVIIEISRKFRQFDEFFVFRIEFKESLSICVDFTNIRWCEKKFKWFTNMTRNSFSNLQYQEKENPQRILLFLLDFMTFFSVIRNVLLLMTEIGLSMKELNFFFSKKISSACISYYFFNYSH